MKGEIIDGVLYAMTRPRAGHQHRVLRISADISYAFERGRGGPGGWWILPEPGIELAGAPEVSPDIAGWRRERLPELPRDSSIAVVPDWVCEVLSPGTRSYHFLRKRPLYARVGVSFLWEVDNDAQVLTVNQLENGRWVELGSFGEEQSVRLPPFDAVSTDVRGWWEDLGVL